MPHYSGITLDGEPHLTLGGVGRNLATALELLGHAPVFITSLGGDNLGQFARAEMRKLLVDGERSLAETRFKILEWSGQGTAAANRGVASSCFALVLIDSLTGQCEYVIANLEAKRAISRENLKGLSAELRSQGHHHTPLVVLDANLLGETMNYLLEICHESRVPIFLEPTDVACLPSLVATIGQVKQARHESERRKLNSLAFLSPNVIELCELVRLFRRQDDEAKGLAGVENISITSGHELFAHEIETLARELMSEHLPSLACLLVTMDKRGLLVAIRSDLENREPLLSQLDQLNVTECQCDDATTTTTNDLRVKFYPPLEVIESPVSGSGAGDCFASGFISGLLSDVSLDECVSLGFKASLCALRDESTVPDSLRDMSAVCSVVVANNK